MVLSILARNAVGKVPIMLHGMVIIMTLCIGKEVIKILRLHYYVMLYAQARAEAQISVRRHHAMLHIQTRVEASHHNARSTAMLHV